MNDPIARGQRPRARCLPPNGILHTSFEHPRTAFPPRRLVCPKGEHSAGTKGHEGTMRPQAHVSTTCADSNQMITSLLADQRQTFSTARNYIRNDRPVASAPPDVSSDTTSVIPPSGYQPHRETRTRRRRMTAESRLFFSQAADGSCRTHTHNATCLAARGRDSRPAVYASGDLPQKTPRLSDAGRLHRIAAHRA